MINLSIKLIRYFFNRPIIRFLTIGVIGLLTDIVVLYLLRNLLDLITAQAIAYVVAVTVSWLLNRVFTFQSEDPNLFKEWFRYSMVYFISGIPNLGLFSALVFTIPYFHAHPIWPVLITAVVIAFLNYYCSKRFAFRTS